MLNGLYSAAAGMIAQQTRIDALSNDISNVNTTGYKQVRTGFRDLVYNIEAGMRIGAGAAVVDAGRLFSQGGLQQNGDPLSVALDGPGFFLSPHEQRGNNARVFVVAAAVRQVQFP